MELRAQRRRASDVLTAAVALLAAAAVLAIGGVHPATQVVLSIGALLIVGGYSLTRRQRGIRSVPFSAAATVAVGVTAIQLLPMPGFLVAWLSPRAFQMRGETGAGLFMPLTIDASATWLALARGLACLALLVSVAGLVRSTRHARRLLWIPAGLGAGLAVIALSQRALGAHAILGVYVPRSTPGFGFFGTFVDVNHAASVLALGCLVSVGLAFDTSGVRRPLAIAAAAASGLALLFTASRGGLLAFGVAGYLAAIILISRRSGILTAVIAATTLVAAVAAAVLWMNEGLRARVTGASAQLWDNQKTRGWLEALRMAVDYRWVGVGRGAFEGPINAYRHADEAVRLVYPENIVLQLLTEWGTPATLAIIALVVASTRRLARPLLRMSPAIVAAGCAVLGVVVHDLFDFGLEFPGVAFPTIVTLAIVVGAIVREQPRNAIARARLQWRHQIPIAATWLLALVGAGWASTRTLDADWERLHVADVNGNVSLPQIEAAIARHPADDFLELVAARAALRTDAPMAMHHVNRALTLHPANWQGHRLAARLLIAAHRPAQAALEYRLAMDNGMGIGVTELVQVLGDYVVDAVAQQPAALQDLARQLYRKGDARHGDAAMRRAVDVADDREIALLGRTRFAMEFGYAAVLDDAAKALIAEATSVDSFAAAVEAFAQANDSPNAESALRAAFRAHPADASLVLVGARARLQLGDLPGARAMLGRVGKLSLSLDEREDAEALLAEIADKSGDVETAALARARARLISRQLHDMTFSESGRTK